MARLVWRDEALTDLENIGHYIEQGSRIYASVVVSRLFESANRLADFPASGRVVPELGREDVRETIVGMYRVIYQLSGDEVAIVAVMHGDRLSYADSRKSWCWSSKKETS